MDGEIVIQERFKSSSKDFRGTKAAPESVGFCWPWIKSIEEHGHLPAGEPSQKVESGGYQEEPHR